MSLQNVIGGQTAPASAGTAVTARAAAAQIGEYNPFKALSNEEESERVAGAVPVAVTSENGSTEANPEEGGVEISLFTGKPKRHRRTKAEMIAARAAEAAAEAATGGEREITAPTTDAGRAVDKIESYGILRKLLEVRQKVSVLDKDSESFDGEESYRYRSLEGILGVVNPVLAECGMMVFFDDDIVNVRDGYVYVRSQARLVDVESGEVFSTSGWAREDFALGEKWASQITGSCSTYARRYALSAMFGFSQGRQDDPDGDGFQTEKNGRDTGVAVNKVVPFRQSAAGGRSLLAPGAGSWAKALKEAAEWHGTVEELESAISARFEISPENLALLIHKAGLS